MQYRALVGSLVASQMLLWGGISSSSAAELDATALDAKMEQAWEVVWQRFFQKDVQIFADYLSSFEAGKELAHLPTADEVKRQFPNPCGYSTGMEDGMILGGAMLSILCDRYAVTGEKSLREEMRRVFSGMRLAVTVHGVPGFVARNVCAEDQKSVYINSSRDQYTHFVHGLWKYYHCPLADEGVKQEIRNIMAAVADRMITYVVPENDYDFCRADGTRCPLGICRMWNVQAHEAARLPMIYAAAWEVTKDERYHQAWRRYVVQAVEQSAHPDENKPAYALLQMQCSLEVLHALESDQGLKEKIGQVMKHVAGLASRRVVKTWAQIQAKPPEMMAMLGPDWRTVPVWKNQKGYPNPQWGEYREIWHITRELGESAIVPLMMLPPQVSSAERELLEVALSHFDYLHNSSCGLIYHLGFYWKARRLGVL